MKLQNTFKVWLTRKPQHAAWGQLFLFWFFLLARSRSKEVKSSSHPRHALAKSSIMNAQLKSPWSLALCSSSSLYTPPSCSQGRCPLQPGSWARSMARQELGPRPSAPRGGPLPRRATNGPLWSSSNPAGWQMKIIYENHNDMSWLDII